MPDHDLEKLLGGFAADTLTTEEKQQLYRAVLQDQTLFNTLADEQALKELLTDPAVRRRLLQSLQKTSSTTAEGSSSWFDWFRRPAGLAWASGIAGAVLAVVLGTSLYREALRQEAQSTAKEEVQPPSPVPTPPQLATPPTAASPTTSEQNSRSALPPTNETLTGKTSPHTPPSRTTPDEPRTRRVGRDAPAPRAKAAPVPKQTESPTEILSNSTDETSPSALQSTVSPAPPSRPASTPPQSQSGVDSTLPSQEPASLSARSLFYGEGPQGQDKSMAGDTRRREKAGSKSVQAPEHSSPTTQPLAMAKSKRASSLQPVGIRYSVSHKEQREHFQDGATDTAPHTVSLELTVESNHDGYLQLWKHDGSSSPQLLFPITAAEQARSKLVAHTPLTISVPSTPGMLVIRFSRTNTIHPTIFDRTLLNDSTRHQLRESVMTNEPSGFPPPIHYIVNQSPSLSEIVVHLAPPQP